MSRMSADEDEAKLARALVNPEKKIRDKTVNSLKSYISSVEELEDLEMLKLWKALFYCMWYSDKPLIQQSLAGDLADLVNFFKNTATALKYFRMFLRTILREWHFLDQYRINKFYMLTRMLLRQALSWTLSMNDETVVVSITEILREEILTRTPNGLRFHIAEIYVPELIQAATLDSGSIDTKRFLIFLEPMFKALRETNDRAFLERVSVKVFEEYAKTYSKETGCLDSVSIEAVQAHIFESASSPETREPNRKRIYQIHRVFQEVTKVQYAQSYNSKTNENGDKNRKKADKQTKEGGKLAGAESIGHITESKKRDGKDSSDNEPKRRKSVRFNRLEEEKELDLEHGEELVPSRAGKKGKVAVPKSKTVKK